jgi:hypothetical protein
LFCIFISEIIKSIGLLSNVKETRFVFNIVFSFKSNLNDFVKKVLIKEVFPHLSLPKTPI